MNPFCSASLDESHCFHLTGYVLLTDPPQDVRVCCFCGEETAVRKIVSLPPSIGHGGFRPSICTCAASRVLHENYCALAKPNAPLA